MRVARQNMQLTADQNHNHCVEAYSALVSPHPPNLPSSVVDTTGADTCAHAGPDDRPDMGALPWVARVVHTVPSNLLGDRTPAGVPSLPC